MVSMTAAPAMVGHETEAVMLAQEDDDLPDRTPRGRHARDDVDA